MLSFMTITKALADENRIRILMALHQRELCVCQITALLDLAPSTTSKHLSLLRQARLIDSTKQGKWVYYLLPELTTCPPLVASTLQWLAASLADNPKILEDVDKLHKIFTLEGLEPCAGNHEHEDHSQAIHALEQDQL